MARTIQSSNTAKAGPGAFLGPLIAVIFWVAVARNFPYERLPEWLSGLAGPRDGLATAAPSLLRTLFYVLAFWAGARALWSLVRIARRFGGAVRFAQLPQANAASRASTASRANAGKDGAAGPGRTGAKGKPSMPKAERPPTVQRMR